MSRYMRWAEHEHSEPARISATLLAGPVFLGLLPFIVGGLGPRLDRHLGFPALGMRRLRRGLGAILLVAGFSLAFWSVVAQLTRGRGTPFPTMPTQQLLTNGPFRYCRNPMTLGTLFAYFGVGLGVGTIAGMLLVLGFVGSLLIYLKRFEEAELTERFGDAYLAYKRDVPFMIPKLPPAR